MDKPTLRAEQNESLSVKFNDLIARLEKATEPSRELDHFIANAILGEQSWSSPSVDWCRLFNAKPSASIDAALTLVPYQREWHVGSVTLLGVFWAEIITPTDRHVARATRSPAIALCIAALKARAQSPNLNNGPSSEHDSHVGLSK